MRFAQFLQDNQGMVEDLTGILIVAVVAYVLIVVPTFIKRTRVHVSQHAGDPMFGTFFAKDYRHRPN